MTAWAATTRVVAWDATVPATPDYPFALLPMPALYMIMTPLPR